MIKTITFGYLPKKWKRLIRTIYLFSYLIGLISSVVQYTFMLNYKYFNDTEGNFLIFFFFFFFISSYILKPFVTKDY